ncbi:MAG: hypothetical protein AAFQ51_01405 [Pseudomonadota bacterium]
MSLKPLLLSAGLVLLAACGVPSNVDPASNHRTPELKTFEYTDASGQTYRIRHLYSASNGSYGTDIKAIGGTPLVFSPEDDARAQNTIRDYFNAEVCSEGFFAGIIGINYKPQPDEEENTYGARLFCTPKKQENI